MLDPEGGIMISTPWMRARGVVKIREVRQAKDQYGSWDRTGLEGAKRMKKR